MACYTDRFTTVFIVFATTVIIVLLSFFLPQIELIGGLIFIVKLFRWTRRKAFKRSRRKNLLKSDEFKKYMLCEPQYDNILLSRFSSICDPDNADGCTFRS